MMKKLTTLGMALVTALAMSACGDVLPNQNTNTLLSHYQTLETSATPEQKRSYYYLLGIGAQSDPLSAGQAYHNELQALLAQDGVTDEQLHALNQRHALAVLPTKESRELPMFCLIGAKNPDAQACFASLLNNKFELAPHATTYERYRQFLAQPVAIKTGKNHLSTHIPNYAMLMQGQRLHLLHHLRERPQAAMTALTTELSALRTQLAHTNGLIDKMIFTKMVAINLQSMVHLKAHHPTVTTPVIEPLSAQERSMTPALVGEFMNSYFLFENLPQQMSGQKGSMAESIKVSLFYKKNKTINAVADSYVQNIQASELPDAEFMTYVNNHTPPKISHDPTNFVGKILAQIGAQDTHGFTYKVKSLDNLISIANHQLHGTPLRNTFSPDNPKAHTQDGRICLSINSPKIEPDTDVECLITTKDASAHH